MRSSMPMPAPSRGWSSLLTGGEAISPSHVRRAYADLPGISLFNGYGPTENTTFTTVYPIPRDLPPSATRVPIGFPDQRHGMRHL